MRVSAKIVLLSMIGVTVSFIALAGWLFSHIGAPPNYTADAQELEHWKFFIDVVEIIAIGFLLASLGFLIPPLLKEAQHKVDRVEASRIAFVEATTEEKYLPTKIAALSYADAVELVESIHLKKRKAESYKELRQHLKLRDEDRLVWHGRLSSTFEVLIGLLESEASNWDSMDCKNRLQLVRKAVPWKVINPD